VRVTADQYPWTASSTGLSSALLPRWSEAGGRAALLARLDNPETAERIVVEMRENLRRRGGAESLLLTGTSIPEPARSLIVGHTLAERAAWTGREPVAAALGIIRDGSASVASFNMIEDDIELLMGQPFVMTGSDGSGGHPRKYATYPRKLRRYVLERGVISLERMIQSSTSQVADVFGLARRGRICIGCHADLIVFDPAAVRENATYTEPELLASGMSWVLVNGVPAVANGELTGELAGRAVRR
jgi:N-acyl-D-amino-acid deacylase